MAAHPMVAGAPADGRQPHGGPKLACGLVMKAGPTPMLASQRWQHTGDGVPGAWRPRRAREWRPCAPPG
jgi:hypothetical protein